MKNKDEALTYDELTALCRKQEEYIKELETHNHTEKCIEPAKPDYDELYRQVQRLNEKIIKLKEENRALRYSLTRLYIQIESSHVREEMWEEEYHREQKRAEKLYNELERKNDE